MSRLFRLAAALLLPLALAPLASGQGFASDAPPSQKLGVEPILTAQPKGGASDLTAIWEGNPQWLVGVDFSGTSFGGGGYYGRDWFSGSSISAAEDVSVRIEFSQTETTFTRVWRRDLGYTDGGVGIFRGAAYDISDPANPRRLNVTFVEDANTCDGSDATWGPSNDDTGCREYLYIMSSSYDGTGQTYAERTPFASSFDLLYAVAGRVPFGTTSYASDPASLTFTFPPLRFLQARVASNGLVELTTTYTPVDGLPAGSTVRFTYAPDGGTPEQISTTYPAGSASGELIASIDGLDTNRFYTFESFIQDETGTVLYQSAAVRVKPLISLNAELLGNWSERGSWSDVWGYTASNGREYALVALQSFGLSVVDITDAPTEVGFVPTAGGASDSKDVKVVGDYAYLINERGSMQVIDLSTPSNPVQVGLVDLQPGVADGGAHNVSVFGEYLYVTGGRTAGNAGLRIYSAANPASPTLVGEYRPDHFVRPYYHDFYVDGDTGYGPNIYGGGIDILDLSDRSNPQRISTFGYPGSGAHNVCGTEDGRYVFVGDEIGSAGQWTRIFDVQDPLNVEFIGDIIVDSEASTHNCYVTGNLLHIGHYTEGYRVFNVSVPTAPVEVAAYDSFLGLGYGYNGVWSIYPYFESGKIAVSDRNGGLFIVRLDAEATDAEPPVLNGPMEITAGPNPASGAIQIRVPLREAGAVRLSVTDILGREVTVLHDGEAVGSLETTLDGSALAPGSYVIRLVTEMGTTTRTITIVR